MLLIIVSQSKIQLPFTVIIYTMYYVCYANACNGHTYVIEYNMHYKALYNGNFMCSYVAIGTVRRLYYHCIHICNITI